MVCANIARHQTTDNFLTIAFKGIPQVHLQKIDDSLLTSRGLRKVLKSWLVVFAVIIAFLLFLDCIALLILMLLIQTGVEFLSKK